MAMNNRIHIFLAAFTVALQGPAWAQFHSGNSLHEVCELRDEGPSAGTFLNGYAAAIADYALMSEEVNATSFICIPQGVRVEQVADVVCNALENKPETRNWPASSLAHNAILEAWRCS